MPESESPTQIENYDTGVLPSHLGLLSLGLQQLDVEVMWACAAAGDSRCGADVPILHQVLVRLLQLDGARAHRPAD